MKRNPKESYEAYFDRKYSSKGGLKRLFELYPTHSNRELAEYFGMSTQGLATALKKILGDQYMMYPYRKMLQDRAFVEHLESELAVYYALRRNQDVE